LRPTDANLILLSNAFERSIDGKISSEEFLQIFDAAALESIHDHDVVEAFVALGGNPDKSGIVDSNKIKKIVSDFGLTVNIKELLELFDTDDSGELEFDEFVEILKSEEPLANFMIQEDTGEVPKPRHKLGSIKGLRGIPEQSEKKEIDSVENIQAYESSVDFQFLSAMQARIESKTDFVSEQEKVFAREAVDKELREAFATIDLDSSGSVSYDELKAALPHLSQTQVADMMKGVNIDVNREINFSNFSIMMRKYLANL